MSLAAASEARKARLLALRRKRAGEEVEDIDGDIDESVLTNRNFDPQTRTLRKHQTTAELEDTIEHNVKGLAEQIIAQDEAKRAQELDLLNIAPKRPNWDLKREMEKKLARLERQTQQAVHTLIRFVTSLHRPSLVLTCDTLGQRLAEQNGQSDDLVGAMQAAANAGNDPPSDDDDDD
ncbi:mRNA splicing factor [Lactarius sanguifluus]|nr:mRNA splicing factor [Lactarius sanguifluus]